IMINLLSHCKAFAEKEDLADQVDEPGPVEEVKFYFPEEPLRDYLGKHISAQALLSRTSVVVNGAVTPLLLPGEGIKASVKDIQPTLSVRYLTSDDSRSLFAWS